MNYINIKRCLLFGVFWVVLGFSASAQNGLLNKEITIAFEDLSIKESLEKLEKTAGFTTAYNDRALADSKITITFEKELLSEVLDALLANKNLSYKVIGNTITIFPTKQEESSKSKESKPSLKESPPQRTKEKYTINGYIMDIESNETLLGATVYCKELELGTATNEYGFYSITLPEGTYELVFSYVGYSSKSEKFSLDKNIEYAAFLSLGEQLKEVVVVADEKTLRHSETQMSSNKISLEKVKSIPALMGERDVLKIIQLMPGVQSGSEGTTGLYVRGGGPDQNLMLLDGVPVYNASHLFGFMSTFNGDAIKSVELIKGGFPARYGGRLSSIIDVRMKEGNMKKIHGDLTIGLVSGRFNLEGPIIKDKTSFSFSGRRTWFDLITTPVQNSINKNAQSTENKQFNAYNLYDINAKINHKFSNKSRLYLSTYLGNDKLINVEKGATSSEDGKMTWGNKLVTARWNYQLAPKLFSNTTLYFSAYDFDFENEFISDTNTSNPVKEYYSSNSNIRDYAGKIDLNYNPHPNHYIRTGIKFGHYKFTPTTSYQELKTGEDPAVATTNGSDKIGGIEMNAYIEDDVILTKKIKINAGIHLVNFSVQNSNYFSFQPRLALSYLVTERSSLKFSATKMTQFLHLLASPGLGLPTDLWVASTDKVKPENSWQFGLGYTQSLGKGYELTVEGFYKDMNNLLAYKAGFNFFSNSGDWENRVDIGDGVSYGGEILLEKTTGKTTGWIGYTLSKSTRKFPNINNGKAFPYKYDRRHDIGAAIIHKKSDRLDFGLVWVYGTGNTYTLGTTNYNALGINTPQTGNGSLFESMGTANYIETRNNQRMPAYHRLDLSANFHKVKKRGKRTWSLGVYNAYARQNPFVVYNTFNSSGDPILKQQSLLPILPYFSYSFKF